MKKWLFQSLGLALVVQVISPIATDARESSVFTPTRGSHCVDRSRAHFQSWRCPGPKGYAAEYFDEGNVVGIAIWAPARTRTPQISIPWRGTGKVFGDLLEWRVRDGQPSAAILRAWRRDTSSEGRERDVEELLVLRLQPSGGCRIASVNARQANANVEAQSLASQASLPCLAGE